MGFETVIFSLYGIFILGLSGLVLWTLFFFRRLSKDVNKGNLVSVLNSVLGKEEENSKKIVDLSRQLIRIEEEGELHVQKVGLVRFNPFEETGGDHSFSVALLNGKNNGFIMTGLHTRERTRVYVKSVKIGKSQLTLSSEEQKALKEALNV